MSLNMAAKHKAAIHAGVAWSGQTQHDGPDVSVQTLSRQHAATELTNVYMPRTSADSL